MDDEHSRGDAGDPLTALGQLLLSEETVETVLDKIAHVACDVVPGADAVSVSLVRDARGVAAAYTGPLALDVDERQHGLDHGPCLDAARGYEALTIADMRTETRWPEYTPFAANRGVLSSLSVPLPVQSEVLGALNVYAAAPNRFADEDTRALAERFASAAAIALANADRYISATELADQMRQAMSSRAVIEQAKGILMAQRRCDASDAFDVLVKASQRENVKLRDIAQRVVDGVRR